MAKRKAKQKTAAEIEAIEADRVAAHEPVVGPNVQTSVFPDKVALEDVSEMTTEQAEAHARVEETFSPAKAELQELETAEREEEAALAEVEEEAKLPNSVVAEKFKLKYIENAKVLGVAGKAAKRSNWDWLAQEIAAECLKEKEKIDIAEFQDLLELNGVDYSRWTNRNKGWEGRFRMTGRVALQKVVANNRRLVKKMSESIPPEAWVERFKTKA